MTTLFVFRFTSRHFTFEAAGTTVEEARKALREGTYRHARTYGIDQNWAREFIGEAEPEIFVAGRCTRDGAPI